MISREDNLERPAVLDLQRQRLHALLKETLPRNRFYAHKFAEAGISPADIDSAADLVRVPFTTKAELIADQQANPPYGSNLTYPLQQYCRMHQTSGTSGQPLRWLDTTESWSWLLGCWESIFDVVGLRPEDRLFFPFSFGPFLGFWTAFEAAARCGFLCLPGGGMSSAARLRFLIDNGVTVVLCTPTYAIRLAEVAQEEGIDLKDSAVRMLIVAGEPGGSIPATRQRIESAWGARIFDHSGMTEVGPVAIECPENPAGLHILEARYVVEVIEPESGRPAAPGQVGELVLTNLGRVGSPLLRYRTGDLVRVDPKPCPCGRHLLRLEGGILGRSDDMIHLRGNNLYPSALEAVVRRFPEVAEYRIEIDDSRALTELRVEVEPVETAQGAMLAERVERAIREELLFRAEVVAVAPGSLPRYEMKSRRLVKHSSANGAYADGKGHVMKETSDAPQGIPELPARKDASPAPTTVAVRPRTEPDWEALNAYTRNLPETDGVPLESPWHFASIALLIEILSYLWRDRGDVFFGGNMFIYYSLSEKRNEDFKGPDFFFVKGVERHKPREFWVLWEEGGKYPDVIVELTSPSTAKADRTTKKDLYENVFHTAEYYCFDPADNRLEGWRLSCNKYEPIATNERGWMWSDQLGMWLGTWRGDFHWVRDRVWLRLYDRDGNLMLHGEEAERLQKEAERLRADTESQRTVAEHQRTDAERQQKEAAQAEVARLKALLAQKGLSPD